MTTETPFRIGPSDLGKPRLRGRLHQYAFFVALACGVVLCSIAATRPGIGPFLSCLVYSLTVLGLFGISALYHRRHWGHRGCPSRGALAPVMQTQSKGLDGCRPNPWPTAAERNVPRF